MLQYAVLVWPCLLLFSIKHVWKKGSLIPVCTFWIIGFIETVINHTDIGGFALLVITCLSVSLVTSHLIYMSGFKAIKRIGLLFTAMLVLEALSAAVGGLNTITDGNGLQMKVYFLGQQPAINRIYCTSLTVLSLLFLLGSKKYRLLSVVGVMAGTYFVFVLDVSTAKVTVAAFVLTLIVTRVIRSKKMWRNISVLLIILILVFTLSGGFSQGFNWLLEGLLNEDVTLNGRTLLWTSALSQMEGWHWLFGNGYGHSYLFYIGGWKVGTAHNQYLNILFCYGFAGLAAYFWVISQEVKAAFTVRDDRVKQIMIASVIAFIITGIPTTTYQSVYIYVLYSVAVNIHYIVQADNNVKPQKYQRRRTLVIKRPKVK